MVFKIPPEGGIKAGRYSLTIIVRDAATRKLIRKGEMPFAVDLLDLIWKCSC